MRKLVFGQSSPVNPVSESRGGGILSMTESEVQTEILVSNFVLQLIINYNMGLPITNIESSTI